MSLTLCMVVKNEINNIQECLDPIVNYLDELIVLDNMSTDGTYEFLKERYNIIPQRGKFNEERCLNKADLRNVIFQNVKTDWILSIDADERVSSESLELLKNKQHDENISGYFGLWENYVNGSEPFEDYKLFLFRKGLQKKGLIHENIQIDIREKGLYAEWLDGFIVKHYPEKIKHHSKVKLYKERLYCAIKKDPKWIRYYWFLGYMYFVENEYNQAIKNFNIAIASKSKLFPVEQLNSAMVLIEIYNTLTQYDKALKVLERAYAIHSLYANDIEVKINHRILPWLDEVKIKMMQGQSQYVKAYRFAK